MYADHAFPILHLLAMNYNLQTELVKYFDVAEQWRFRRLSSRFHSTVVDRWKEIVQYEDLDKIIKPFGICGDEETLQKFKECCLNSLNFENFYVNVCVAYIEFPIMTCKTNLLLCSLETPYILIPPVARNSKVLMQRMIENNASALLFAHKHLCEDEKIVARAIELDASTIRFAGSKLRQNKEFMEKITQDMPLNKKVHVLMYRQM